MMERVGKAIRVEFCGERRLFLYSLRVARDVMQRTDAEAENGGDEIGDIAFVAHRMMEAGARYAKANDYENPEPLTEEQVLDLCDMEDYGIIAEIIKTATRIGKKTEIAAVDGDGGENGEEKNAQGAKPEN